MRIIILIGFLFFKGLGLSAQKCIQFRCALTDSVLSHVEIKSEKLFTQSRADGQVCLPIPSNYHLLHIGYTEQEIYLTDAGDSIIFLVPLSGKLDEIELVSKITGVRPIESPFQLEFIRPRDWLTNNAENTLVTLANIPGVDVQSGAYNTNRISIRGIGSRSPFSSNRVKAYIDDVPISSGDGETELDDLDVSIFQSIEILKGGQSAFFGNGMGGVVVLQTKKVAADGLHGSIRQSVGSDGLINSGVQFTFRDRKQKALVDLSRNHSNGWRENDDYERHSAFIKYSLNLKATELSFFTCFKEFMAFIPSSIGESLYRTQAESAAANWTSVRGNEDNRRWLTALKLSGSYLENVSTEISVFYNDLEGHERRPFNTLVDHSQRWGLVPRIHFNGKKIDLTFAAELMRDQYEWATFETLEQGAGDRLSNYKEIRSPVTIMTRLGLRLSQNLRVMTGLGYNALDYELENLSNGEREQYAYEKRLTPSIGLNMRLTDALHIYTSYGEGVSFPSLQETLLPDGEKNPSIEPEFTRGVDLGARAHFMNQTLSLNVAGYYTRVENLLVSELTIEGAMISRNAGSSSHLGVELSSQLKHTFARKGPIQKLDWKCSANIGRHVFENFVNNGIDRSGNNLPAIPRWSISSQIDMHLSENFMTTLQYQGRGLQYLTDSNTQSLSASDIYHLGLTYTKALGSFNLIKVSCTIENVFNERYASMIIPNAPSFSSEPRYYYPGQNTNWRMKVAYIF